MLNLYYADTKEVVNKNGYFEISDELAKEFDLDFNYLYFDTIADDCLISYERNFSINLEFLKILENILSGEIKLSDDEMQDIENYFEDVNMALWSYEVCGPDLHKEMKSIEDKYINLKNEIKDKQIKIRRKIN